MKNGAKKVFIHTVDTYVVGIAISHYRLRLIQAGNAALLRLFLVTSPSRVQGSETKEFTKNSLSRREHPQISWSLTVNTFASSSTSSHMIKILSTNKLSKSFMRL